MSRYLTLVPVLFVPLGLYLPVRLVAQEFNTATYESLGAPVLWRDGDFFYAWAILLWPMYMFLVGFLSQFYVSWLKFGWRMRLLMLIGIFFLSYGVTGMDDLLGIPGGGLDGFISSTVGQTVVNTTMISQFACPPIFLLGCLLGRSVGKLVEVNS